MLGQQSGYFLQLTSVTVSEIIFGKIYVIYASLLRVQQTRQLREITQENIFSPSARVDGLKVSFYVADCGNCKRIHEMHVDHLTDNTAVKSDT